MATRYHSADPRIWLNFWWIVDRWTLICFAQKNPLPLLPKHIKPPLSFLWQACSLLSLCAPSMASVWHTSATVVTLPYICNSEGMASGQTACPVLWVFPGNTICFGLLAH